MPNGTPPDLGIADEPIITGYSRISIVSNRTRFLFLADDIDEIDVDDIVLGVEDVIVAKDDTDEVDVIDIEVFIPAVAV